VILDRRKNAFNASEVPEERGCSLQMMSSISDGTNYELLKQQAEARTAWK